MNTTTLSMCALLVSAPALAGELDATPVDRPLSWRQEDRSISINGYTQFRHTANWRDRDAAGAEDFTDFDFVIQGGIYVDEQDELFARTDVIFADADRPNHDPFPSITVGYTHYVMSHALKLTSDATCFPTGTTDNDLVGAGFGLLASNGAQVVLRVQLQAIF